MGVLRRIDEIDPEFSSGLCSFREAGDDAPCGPPIEWGSWQQQIEHRMKNLSAPQQQRVNPGREWVWRGWIRR
jgi:hypothetical protein